jgi:adenine-specific DNA glycosylase
MMELGATVCTPRLPSCEECPLAKWCRARKLNITDKVPLKRTKPALLKIKIATAVLLDLRGRTLLVNSGLATNGLVRPGSKRAGTKNVVPDREISALFSNLWRFPSVPVRRNGRAELARHLREVFDLDVNAAQLEPLPDSRHAVTFRRVTLTPFLLRIGDLPSLSDSMRLPLTQLSRFPISNATRKIARSAQKFIDGGTSSKASGTSRDPACASRTKNKIAGFSRNV